MYLNCVRVVCYMTTLFHSILPSSTTFFAMDFESKLRAFAALDGEPKQKKRDKKDRKRHKDGKSRKRHREREIDEPEPKKQKSDSDRSTSQSQSTPHSHTHSASDDSQVVCSPATSPEGSPSMLPQYIPPSVFEPPTFAEPFNLIMPSVVECSQGTQPQFTVSETESDGDDGDDDNVEDMLSQLSETLGLDMLIDTNAVLGTGPTMSFDHENRPETRPTSSLLTNLANVVQEAALAVTPVTPVTPVTTPVLQNVNVVTTGIEMTPQFYNPQFYVTSPPQDSQSQQILTVDQTQLSHLLTPPEHKHPDLTELTASIMMQNLGTGPKIDEDRYVKGARGALRKRAPDVVINRDAFFTTVEDWSQAKLDAYHAASWRAQSSHTPANDQMTIPPEWIEGRRAAVYLKAPIPVQELTKQTTSFKHNAGCSRRQAVKYEYDVFTKQTVPVYGLCSACVKAEDDPTGNEHMGRARMTVNYMRCTWDIILHNCKQWTENYNHDQDTDDLFIYRSMLHWGTMHVRAELEKMGYQAGPEWPALRQHIMTQILPHSPCVRFPDHTAMFNGVAFEECSITQTTGGVRKKGPFQIMFFGTPPPPTPQL